MNLSLDISPDEHPLAAHALALKPMAGEASRPETDIAALTNALRGGDEQAWREFHGRYFSRLQRYLLVVMRGDQDAAQEALQHTFLRAATHMRSFETENALWNWLAVLARCSAVDEQRKRTRRLGLIERFFQSRSELPATPADPDRLLGQLLERALAGLAEDERTLIQRKYLDGESVRDLAASLDTTESAVDSRLVRVRRKLKQAVLTLLRHESSA